MTDTCKEKEQSATPRTDAAEAEYNNWLKYAEQYGHIQEAMEQAPAEADPFFIARQLERELAEALHWKEVYFRANAEARSSQSASGVLHELLREAATRLQELTLGDTEEQGWWTAEQRRGNKTRLKILAVLDGGNQREERNG